MKDRPTTNITRPLGRHELLRAADDVMDMAMESGIEKKNPLKYLRLVAVAATAKKIYAHATPETLEQLQREFLTPTSDEMAGKQKIAKKKLTDEINSFFTPTQLPAETPSE